MVYVPSTAGYAAAVKSAEERKEEEEMTKYNNDDINGWEFKIVRSGTGKFKNQEFIQKVCQEEARAGWEMLEKFDDYRIRFKRKTDMRTISSHQEIDPYRTYVGMNPNLVGPLVAFALAILIAGIALAANFSGKSGKPAILIVPILIVMLGVVFLAVKYKFKNK